MNLSSSTRITCIISGHDFMLEDHLLTSHDSSPNLHDTSQVRQADFGF